MNEFLTTPPAVIVWDPKSFSPRRSFVFLGDVPHAIARAVTAYKQSPSNASKQALKEYYGSNFEEKLLLGNVKLLPHLTRDEIAVGGNESESGGAVYNDNNDVTAGITTASILTRDTTIVNTSITGADDELDDIEALLADTKKEASAVKIQGAIDIKFEPGVEYVSGVNIYPEDKYTELKEKIYVATGIPIYRQHLFYYDQNRVQTTYKLYADGVYPVDIRGMFGGVNTEDSNDSNDFKDKITQNFQLQSIHGIPIDKYLYDTRSDVKVEALDVFQTLGNSLPLNNRVFVVDLGAFTNPLRTQLIDLLKDTYQFELLYYGTILKYWPQLTMDCFRDYIADENDLPHKYPDLAPNINTLRSVYKTEAGIVNGNYKHMQRLLSLVQAGTVSLAITQMTAQVNGNRVMLNIRNLFDHFRATKCVPEIHAWIETENKRYLLVKRHVQAADINFPSGATLRTGITFAISLRKADQDTFHTKKSASVQTEQARYLFLNIWPSGRYHIKTIWNEEDELGFDEILSVMKKFVDPIITEINSLGHFAFISAGRLQPLSKLTITYHGLNVCMFWKRVMTDATYKMVKGLWEPYFRGRIISSRNVQQFDKYEFTLRKGIYQFDNSAIERIVAASSNVSFSNYYSYMSNQVVKQKWDQNYEGRVVRMSHRTTDIRIEIVDIRELEFQTAYIYILGFIYSAQTNADVKKSLESVRDYTDVKKLRKLREQDPELYNLKKYGSTKVYSIICQNQRQPIIYTEDELRQMSVKEKAALTKYWNFTLQKPAWYGCPNTEYPHLSFMVGAHPRHYCLPCCNKKTREDDDSRKTKVNSVCLAEHIWNEDSDDGSLSRHVMNYGKDIDVGRLSKLPQTSLKNLLYDTIANEYVDSDITASANTTVSANDSIADVNTSKKQPVRKKLAYYLYGVPQHFPGIDNMGIVYAIAEGLSISVEEFINTLIASLSQMTLNTLIGGVLIDYFSNTSGLTTLMHELFIDGKIIATVRLEYWPELISELTYLVYGLSVATFIDSTGTGVGISLHTIESVKNEILGGNANCLVICKRENRYYPMFAIDVDVYFKRLEVHTKIFPGAHPLGKLLKSMVIMFVNGNHVGTSLYTLELLKQFAQSSDWKISTKYVNQHNLCYGAMLVKSMDINTNADVNTGTPHVYIPVDYSTSISDGIKVSHMPPDDSIGIFLEDTIEVLNALISYTDVAMRVYKPMKITSLVYFNDMLIGARADDMMIYVNAVRSNISQTSIGRIDAVYDFREVNRVVMKRAMPVVDKRTTELGRALYNNYQYQLLVVEFVNYLDKERNAELRGKLMTLIADTNFKKDLAKFRGDLRRLMSAHVADYNLLQSQVNEFYHSGANKNNLRDVIAGTLYEFDRITLTFLRSLDINTRITELRKIVSSFAVTGTPSVTDFPNIYLPCEEMGTVGASYCSGSRLILQDLDKYVNVLAVDIGDDLKSSYLMNNIWMDSIIDVFGFTKVSTEVITIYRLNE